MKLPEWLQKKQQAAAESEKRTQEIHREVRDLWQMMQRDGPRFWKSIIKDLETNIAASKMLGVHGSVSRIEPAHAGGDAVRVTATHKTTTAHVDLFYAPPSAPDAYPSIGWVIECRASNGDVDSFKFHRGSDRKLCVYTKNHGANGGGPGFKPGEYIAEHIVNYITGEKSFIFYR
jgi:hypothetical protein